MRPALRSARAGAVICGALTGLLVAMAVIVGPVAAAEPASFGKPTVEIAFGSGITFSQPVTITADVARAEVLLTFPGGVGPLAVEVPIPAGTGPRTLSYVYEVAPGDLAPNTPIDGRWRLTDGDGSEVVGPSVVALYADDRFAWKTRVDGLMRLHWYEGDDTFADRALGIAIGGFADAQAFLGVTETEPVDFFVYSSQDDIYQALAPDRENVGGQAFPPIRTLFALITPTGIDDPWVGVVLPHEITHLVFHTAIKDSYGYPPKWVDEGLAVYLSEGYTTAYRDAVEQAAGDRTLIPLDGLTGQFPTSFDRFGLAYGESVSAIDYIARTRGETAVKELVDAYGRGLTDAEAFEAAVGMDSEAFGAAWLTDLGATESIVQGPRAGAPGPIPNGWAVGPATGSAANPNSAASDSGFQGEGVGLILASAALALAVIGGLAVRLRRDPGSTTV